MLVKVKVLSMLPALEPVMVQVLSASGPVTSSFPLPPLREAPPGGLKAAPPDSWRVTESLPSPPSKAKEAMPSKLVTGPESRTRVPASAPDGLRTRVLSALSPAAVRLFAAERLSVSTPECVTGT